jgi:excinuclease ABC subunit C
LRDKSTLTSPLELVPGIGKKRHLQLLKNFGSLDGIRAASPEQLQALPGITENLALKILDTLGRSVEQS